MTFGATFGKYFMMNASVNMFNVAADYKNKTYMEVANNISISFHQVFSKQWILWCPRDHCTADNLRKLDTNLL